MRCDLPRADQAYRSLLEIDDQASISNALQSLPEKRMLSLEAKVFGQGPLTPAFGDDILPIPPQVPSLQSAA